MVTKVKNIVVATGLVCCIPMSYHNTVPLGLKTNIYWLITND